MEFSILVAAVLFGGLFLAALHARRTIHTEGSPQRPVVFSIGMAALLMALTARLAAHALRRK